MNSINKNGQSTHDLFKNKRKNLTYKSAKMKVCQNRTLELDEHIVLKASENVSLGHALHMEVFGLT